MNLSAFSKEPELSFLIHSRDFSLQLKKTSKRLLRDKPSGSDDEDNHMIAYHTNENKIDNIGDANPIQDFEAMISRRDNHDWIDKAITQMKNRIVKLVEEDSTDESDRALECLLALRKGCVLEQVSFSVLYLELVAFCSLITYK